MSFENEINTLFQAGLKLFNDKNFYDAHEKWEDLWADYYLKDRLFIQGLIQLSVSFVHLKNNNMNGAKSLLNKCKQKFEGFDIQRGIDVKKLLIIFSLKEKLPIVCRFEYSKTKTAIEPIKVKTNEPIKIIFVSKLRRTLNFRNPLRPRIFL